MGFDPGIKPSLPPGIKVGMTPVVKHKGENKYSTNVSYGRQVIQVQVLDVKNEFQAKSALEKEVSNILRHIKYEVEGATFGEKFQNFASKSENNELVINEAFVYSPSMKGMLSALIDKVGRFFTTVKEKLFGTGVSKSEFTAAGWALYNSQGFKALVPEGQNIDPRMCNLIAKDTDLLTSFKKCLQKWGDNRNFLIEEIKNGTKMEIRATAYEKKAEGDSFYEIMVKRLEALAEYGDKDAVWAQQNDGSNVNYKKFILELEYNAELQNTQLITNDFGVEFMKQSTGGAGDGREFDAIIASKVDQEKLKDTVLPNDGSFIYMPGSSNMIYQKKWVDSNFKTEGNLVRHAVLALEVGTLNTGFNLVTVDFDLSPFGPLSKEETKVIINAIHTYMNTGMNTGRSSPERERAIEAISKLDETEKKGFLKHFLSENDTTSLADRIAETMERQVALAQIAAMHPKDEALQVLQVQNKLVRLNGITGSLSEAQQQFLMQNSDIAKAFINVLNIATDKRKETLAALKKGELLKNDALETSITELQKSLGEELMDNQNLQTEFNRTIGEIRFNAESASSNLQMFTDTLYRDLPGFTPADYEGFELGQINKLTFKPGVERDEIARNESTNLSKDAIARDLSLKLKDVGGGYRKRNETNRVLYNFTWDPGSLDLQKEDTVKRQGTFKFEMLVPGRHSVYKEITLDLGELTSKQTKNAMALLYSFVQKGSLEQEERFWEGQAKSLETAGFTRDRLESAFKKFKQNLELATTEASLQVMHQPEIRYTGAENRPNLSEPEQPQIKPAPKNDATEVSAQPQEKASDEIAQIEDKLNKLRQERLGRTMERFLKDNSEVRESLTKFLDKVEEMKNKPNAEKKKEIQKAGNDFIAKALPLLGADNKKFTYDEKQEIQDRGAQILTYLGYDFGLGQVDEGRFRNQQ